MTDRKVHMQVRGRQATDGAGVRLVRVFGAREAAQFDPFLMLDGFDSTDPEDYVRGFPMHPHRGIETVTYLISGEISHKDSLGNRGLIRGGESQWMCAGGGILHEEMPLPSVRMLGFQLWLNLPSAEKMVPPAYFDITAGDIGVVEEDGAVIRVIAGAWNDVHGVRPRHVQATILDISLEAGAAMTIPAARGETAFLYLLEGGLTVAGEPIPEKTAVLLGDGDHVQVGAPEKSARFAFFCAPPLHEPIAWGGPIVMNTDEELQNAFRQLRQGTFLGGPRSSASSPS